MSKCDNCANVDTDECNKCSLRTHLCKHYIKFEHKTCSNCYWNFNSDHCISCTRNIIIEKLTDKWIRR
jgi:hypothetical protein